MADEIIKTQVDDLLELLKHTSKIPLADAAKKLDVAIDVLQAWVDFLVEENIIGIEYSFTTPFIYLNKPIELKNTSKMSKKDEESSIEYFKTEFWGKAKSNNIPEQKIDSLWKNHLLQALELQKKFFLYEAQRRNLTKVAEIWEEYHDKMALS